jgi:hypothetical protein
MLLFLCHRGLNTLSSIPEKVRPVLQNNNKKLFLRMFFHLQAQTELFLPYSVHLNRNEHTVEDQLMCISCTLVLTVRGEIRQSFDAKMRQRYLDMMTGTGAATFPTSSSLCIIFLIRA